MNERLFSYPDIDEIAFSIGPLDIRWYALAYVAGIILGWFFLRHRINRGLSVLKPEQLDILLNAVLFGIIVGGRLGYVLFYNPGFYMHNLLDILKVWQGGMSFHGGFLGVMAAIIYCASRFDISGLALGDEIATITPLGLFFGRIANFINGELFGRVTQSPFGIIFPEGGPEPRHPSQLYEAFLEGIVLLIFLLWLSKMKQIRKWRDGVIVFGFLAGYGSARFMVEFVREPDRHIGFLTEFAGLSMTMGHWLSLPMILTGFIGFYFTTSYKQKQV